MINNWEGCGSSCHTF